MNYGIPADYEALERAGDLGARAPSSSRATAARGAGSSRRSRPSTARSAASSIPIRGTTAITQGTSIPAGPWRPSDGVQRGSVMDMPLHPGDPLTPGVGAVDRRTAAADRGGGDDHEDPGASDLLCRRAAAARRARRRGRARSWRGGLPITYHVGPGPGAGSPQGPLRLEDRDALQRDRPHSRERRCPTNGSSAAIITTPGSTAPRIRSRDKLR